MIYNGYFYFVVVAVILPTTFHLLHLNPPPVKQMIELDILFSSIIKDTITLVFP